MRLEGPSVIGLTIMPLSERFTRSTSEACSSIDRFLWMTPRPPCWAMAIARLDSVTVSIAALTSGTFNRTLRVRRVETSTCVGSTVECCGTRSTSSNVSAVASSVPVGRRVREPVFNSIEILAAGLTRPALRSRAVALLVLLAAAARAGLIASDLRLFAPDGLDHVVAARPRGVRSLGFAAIGGLPRRSGRSGASRSREGGNRRFGGWLVHRDWRGAPWHGTRSRGRLFVHHGTKPHDVADHFFLDPVLHVSEEIEAFPFVLDERVALPVPAKADAFLQVVERVEVVFPLRVDDLQHDVALHPPQQVGPDHLLFLFVARLDQRPRRVADFVRAHLVELQRFQLIRFEAEHPRHFANQRGDVPVLELGLLAGEAFDVIVEDVFRKRHQVGVRIDDLLLGEMDLALENLAAQRVHAFTLLVHDIVVLEEVFPDGEVLRLDLLLGALDGARHHPMLDGDAFLHPETLHETGDPFGPENAHQVVFEREIEARGPRVALPARPAPQLVVDAACLVALRAEDVQASELDHLFMLGQSA